MTILIKNRIKVKVRLIWLNLVRFNTNKNRQHNNLETKTGIHTVMDITQINRSQQILVIRLNNNLMQV